MPRFTRETARLQRKAAQILRVSLPLSPCSIRIAAMQRNRMVKSRRWSNILSQPNKDKAGQDQHHEQENEMAVMTFERAGAYDGAAKSKGFARRLLDRYIEAQMRKARRHVIAYLQGLDDKALRNLGYSGAEIERIRQSDASIAPIA
jgi:hypothetical protein